VGKGVRVSSHVQRHPKNSNTKGLGQTVITSSMTCLLKTSTKSAMRIKQSSPPQEAIIINSNNSNPNIKLSYFQAFSASISTIFNTPYLPQSFK
jgi:hypothetical protein